MRHSNGKRPRTRPNNNNVRRSNGGGSDGAQNPNRAFDSNGPAGRLRGTAAQLAEKYSGLALDARVGRDRVLVENYQQHAEHYQRILNEAQAQQDQAQRDRGGQPGKSTQDQPQQDQPQQDQPLRQEAQQDRRPTQRVQQESTPVAARSEAKPAPNVFQGVPAAIGAGKQPVIDQPVIDQPVVELAGLDEAVQEKPKPRRRAAPKKVVKADAVPEAAVDNSSTSEEVEAAG